MYWHSHVYIWTVHFCAIIKLIRPLPAPAPARLTVPIQRTIRNNFNARYESSVRQPIISHLDMEWADLDSPVHVDVSEGKLISRKTTNLKETNWGFQSNIKWKKIWLLWSYLVRTNEELLESGGNTGGFTIKINEGLSKDSGGLFLTLPMTRLKKEKKIYCNDLSVNKNKIGQF